MKNAKLTILISGLISIAATVIFYLLTFDNIFTIPMRWVSLMFLLITECIGTLKALIVKHNIITQAITFTSIFHLAAVLLLSIVFVNFLPLALKTYILLNVLMLCVLAIADIFILHFSETASASDKKLAQSQGVMNACYSKVQGMMVEFADSEYKKDLAEIAELIRYSDNSELTDDEAAILGKLGELETFLKESSKNIPALITEIKNALNIRTIKMQSIKRGGY